MGNLTRRTFISRLFVVGASGAAVLGCSDQDSVESVMDPPEISASEPSGMIQKDFFCEDVTGLTETEIAMREAREYTDMSLEEDQNCSNCLLYVEPEPHEKCGGCLTIKGPIHPEGYCTIWVAQTS